MNVVSISVSFSRNHLGLPAIRGLPSAPLVSAWRPVRRAPLLLCLSAIDQRPRASRAAVTTASLAALPEERAEVA